MASKVKRLSKVAKELNVGISTLVDFLGSKGVEIDSKPNTKLTDEHYSVLKEEYSDDQELKEEAEKKVLDRHKNRKTISLKDETQEKNDAADSKNEIPAEAVESVPETEKKEEEKPEKEEKKEEPAKEDSPKIKVINKIDVSTIDSSTRPKKKAKKEEKNVEKENVKEKEKTAVPKEDKPKKEETQKEKQPTEEKREKFATKTTKLAGPKVVGSIELKEEDKKKSSSKNKRKRKRIKKVDINKSQKKKKFKKGKTPEQQEITEEDIEKEIKKTLQRLKTGGDKKTKSGAKRRRDKREQQAEIREQQRQQEELDKSVLKLTEFVSVSELATMMDVQSTEVISACMSLGIFASINQRLDAETIQIVADEFGYEVEFVAADVQDSIRVEEDDPNDLSERPPIITVMGHVDHGKTSLLDYVRNANIAEGEAGGITQHIGAYSVVFNDRRLTFLDTPGHEAFTAMRARGAQVTDVAIIIIAADDDVMPQTKEAISHAQAANVPMVIAINKIDKPGANPNKIKEQLSNMNILVEDWGGKYQCQEISAKKGLHIDELLEKVLLEADLLELKANPNKNAIGTVLESSLDKGKGYVTNILVEAGTLRVGDTLIAGKNFGKVRAMHNEKGQNQDEILPSYPASIIGINGAPSAGDKFYVMDDEREAKKIATRREQLHREQGLRTQKHITLDEIGRRLAIGDFQELNVIVKGDVDGSIEALSDSLLKLSTEEIQVNIIHKGVGAITEADVNLAVASDAVIIGFQVRPTASAKNMAGENQIDIRLYSVIYKAIDELKSAMEGMLAPEIVEEVVGSAEVRETFKISKVGTIAGCLVTSGYIKRNSKIRIIRDGIVKHDGKLGSLKRFKDDVKEVKNNYECGLNIEGYNDIKEGDIIEVYEESEVARKLK